MTTEEEKRLLWGIERGYLVYIFNIHDLGEDMQFLESKGSKQRLLIDWRTKQVVELTDFEGTMVAFTEQDVCQSVRDRDVNTDNAVRLRALYRFWVYEFQSGRARVSWTVCPDGRFFADEDGFGGEDYNELTVQAVINRKGKVLIPFH